MDTSDPQPNQGAAATACSYDGCTEPAWGTGGTCLFHSPDNAFDAEGARAVWQRARETIHRGEPGHFAGWHFPPDPDRLGFASQTFAHGANFANATFHGEALFRRAAFKAVTVFDGASFLGEATFEGATFDEFAAFDGVTFTGRANFSQCVFTNETWFIGSTFGATADFLNASFNNVATFHGSTFRGNASFSYVVFRSVAQFEGATFHAAALFSILGNDLPTQADFDLPRLRLPWKPPAPFLQQEHGEQAYRLAKQSAQQHGDYRRAGEYHYAEQCAIHFGRRKLVNWRFWRPGFWWYWLEYLFARGLLGYGEKPARVLLAGLLVILLSATLFWSTAGICPGGGREATIAYRPTFQECLHFSAVTFTTVGYGDYKPKPACRLWADAEAFVGAAFLAMFVVALTRKYMR
ncbi:MAG: pentapeptide repeat-containing protein [Phycisphaerae bacterium]|nr:pentapeptide repeat-containing protein [Phycisphaerae bacterium]